MNPVLTELAEAKRALAMRDKQISHLTHQLTVSDRLVDLTQKWLKERTAERDEAREQLRIQLDNPAGAV